MANTAEATADQTVVHVSVGVDPDGNVVCEPKVVTVTDQNALITFDLVGSGWAFPDSGAVVVTPSSPQFPLPSWTLNPTQAALLDYNTQAGAFKYTVTVENTVTGEQRSLDPGIRNDPD